ncbi:histidine phosphatase family protein [Desulfonatronum sp. SC1]|uniref:histidine phosphatase family protein n=1 Tax=Desulfonatronum sp. SC1 TaxID=2109626 RepID=UPI001304FAD3|nr:histidine phosphatase family protein [Desulfonatronum sp. SC1]
MRDGIYRLKLTAHDGMEHGAIHLANGAFFGAGLGYVYQGRLEPIQDDWLTGTMKIRKTVDQTAPLLGQFKEATLDIRGTWDPVSRSFSWRGQAYGHHSIVIQGQGHELPARSEPAPRLPIFKPSSLILLRHASVERSPGMLFGTDDVPLNDVGLRQAMAWQSVFAASPPAAVFVSPLQRAVQTARLAVAALADTLFIREELREIDLGAWEGMSREEIERHSPGAWEERGKNFAGYRPAGGENFQDVQDRIYPVFQEMSAMAKAQDKPVLAVTHAGVIRALLCHILGMPMNNLFRIQMDWASLSILEPAAGMWRVRCVNMLPFEQRSLPG